MGSWFSTWYGSPTRDPPVHTDIEENERLWREHGELELEVETALARAEAQEQRAREAEEMAEKVAEGPTHHRMLCKQSCTTMGFSQQMPNTTTSSMV